VEFRLLGPVEAHHRDVVLALGRRRERALLGLLLLEAGRGVSVERLIDLLWDTDPPRSARQALHTNVARLRALLTPCGVSLTTRNGSYLADVPRSAVDAHRFEEAVSNIRRSLPFLAKFAKEHGLTLPPPPKIEGASYEDKLHAKHRAEDAMMKAIEKRSAMRISIAAPKPSTRARSRCSGGSLPTMIVMNTMLSMPSTISSAVKPKVSRALLGITAPDPSYCPLQAEMADGSR
jgi:hypothetical protein